jgi:hypothetical protein
MSVSNASFSKNVLAYRLIQKLKTININYLGSYGTLYRFISGLTFCGTCIMIYLRNKDQKDVLFSPNLYNLLREKSASF